MSIYLKYPRYKHELSLGAFKIGSVVADEYRKDTWVLNPYYSGEEGVRVTDKWHRRYRPQPGGYFVVYENGRTSYYPEATFDDCYPYPVDVLEDMLKMEVNRLPLADRTLRALLANKLLTVGDLLRHSRREIYALRGIGFNSITEIEDVLDSMGLQLSFYSSETSSPDSTDGDEGAF